MYAYADVIGIGFEEEVIIVPESVGTVSVCVVTNLTLGERQTASAVLQTETISAEGQCCLFVSHRSLVPRLLPCSLGTRLSYHILLNFMC